MQQDEEAKFKKLRQDAQAFIRENPKFAKRYGAENIQELVQELQIYHAELEAQNEELRQAQQELIESRNRYYSLYDLAPMGYCTLDLTGVIQEINLTGARMLSRPRAQILNHSFSFYLRPEDRDLFQLSLKAVLRGEPTRACLVQLAPKEGRSTVYLQLECNPVRARGTSLSGFGLVFTDVTVLKQQEQRLQELNATLEERVADRTKEVQRQADQLRALSKELIRAEQRERQRLATELHDYLAQLLVVMRLKIDSLKALAPPPELDNGMDEISRLVQEAQTYTRTLIADLSPAVLYEQGLPKALKRLAQDMQRLGLHVNLDIKSTGDLEPETALLAYRSVRELLYNVVKAADTDSATLTMDAKSDYLCLVIEDDGTGFDLREVERLAPESGHFGLTIVRQQMETIGGRFDLRSQPGKGTRGRLWLPLAPVRKAEDQACTVGVSWQPQPARGETITVLIADDHDLVRKDLHRLMDAYGGFQIVGEARDGVEAVEQARRLRPNAIIMDVNMPRMNGIDATRIISQECASTTIIGWSIRDDDAVSRDITRAGAAAFFTKGTPITQICQALQENLANRT